MRLLLLLVIPLTQATLVLEKIDSQLGYAEVQMDKVIIVNKFDLVLHIIYPGEILKLVDDVELTIEPLKFLENHKLLLTRKISKIRHKVHTMMPNREKRAILGFAGSFMKWLYGTMDDEDRQDIENHFVVTDENNHEIIENMNRQIKINNSFNKTFTIFKDIINNDRKTIKDKLKDMNKVVLDVAGRGVYAEYISKLSSIEEEVDIIQNNIASARTGILHPGILTDEEISDYNIDLHKLYEIRLGTAVYKDDRLIFIIKIPAQTVQLTKKLLIPVPNQEHKEIDANLEYVVDYKNKSYTYTNHAALKELKISEHCVVRNTCRWVENKNEEVREVDDNAIIIINARDIHLRSDCDQRKFILKGNYFATFNNCTMEVKNIKYGNRATEYVERFVVPNPTLYTQVNSTIEFKEIKIEQFENLKFITEHKYFKVGAYSLGTIALIIFIVIIIFYFIAKRRKGVKVKVVNSRPEIITIRDPIPKLPSPDVERKPSRAKPGKGKVAFV